MVLLSVIDFVSNIYTGRLLVKPFPDLGSTAAPFPATPLISLINCSVSRYSLTAVSE